MSKIITNQLQAPGGPALSLPMAFAAGQILGVDAAGQMSFFNSPAPIVSTVNPTTTTNLNLGQVWINTTTSELFICTSAVTNLNVWVGNKGTGIGRAAGQALLAGAGLPTISANVGLGSVWINTDTSELFICVDATTNANRWLGNLGGGVNLPQGQQLIDTVGTQSFVVPAGVRAISAVLVGAGGGGHYSWSSYAGGGGALAYANAIPVTPGETLTLVIGAGGTIGSAGGDTILKRGTTVLFTAQGGQYGATSTRATYVSGTIAAKGGSGGLCSPNGYGGGGGAGGYSGNGGDGSYGSPNTGGTMGSNGGNGSGGGGGGGSGYQSSTYGFGGGGGVGLYGEGSSGAQGNSNDGNTWTYTSSGYGGYGGKGGSGGEQGSPNSNSSQTINGRTTYHGEGGKYGGGGGGSGTSVSSNGNFCKGGQGGSRIIWGNGRAFPATNTADMTTIA